MTPITPESLHAAQYEPDDSWDAAMARLVARKRREQRIRELVRVLRDPANSAPMTELLDLLEGKS